MTDSDPSDRTVWYRQDWLQNSKGNWVIADEQQVDAVPVEALQELHSDLLNTAQQAGSGGHYETANVVESFAEDVEALIDDYSYE